MHYKPLKLSILLMLFAGFTNLQAQQSINSAGGTADGSNGSATYSVGQIMYHTKTGSNGSVAEGVQQPYEISVVTAIENASEINLSVTAYPNPTIDFLKVKVERGKVKGYSYQLFDMNGQLLLSQKITGKETSIDMGKYVPASYFLKVVQGNLEFKTFKIVKR